MCLWLTDSEFLSSSIEWTREILTQKASDAGPGLSVWRLGGESRLSRRLADRDLEGADAVDPAFYTVAGRTRGAPGRRPRHDDIAGADLDLLRKLPDDLGHAPDQFGEVALLPLGAVDREPDFSPGRMADFRGRLQRAAGRGVVERFADLPRPLLLARGELQVAPGEVDADAVAVDVVERLVGGNVEATALHGDDQFDLVMQIFGQRRVGDGGAVALQHVGMLGKKERRRPLVIAHLADVLDVIAPDAPDAAHRKRFGVAGNRDRSLRRGGNDERGGVHEHFSAGFWGGKLRPLALRGCADRRQPVSRNSLRPAKLLRRGPGENKIELSRQRN